MFRRLKILLISTIVFFSATVFAYDEPQYSNNFLLSIYFKAVELRDRAIMEIRKIDMEIAKNNETIQKSENIISLAQQKGNTKAEMIARDALIKAQEAKGKNEETRKHWELQKIRADRSYTTIQNMLSQKYDSKQQIKGFLGKYTGNVYIIKANGERVTPENGFLEPGDKVWTGDGTAEIQVLDGRATARIGPYSEFEMKKDTPEEQIVELTKGKIYMAVDKIDEYAKKMKEMSEKYKNDLKIIRDIKEEDLEKIGRLFTGKFDKRFVHKCPTAVIGVRGTKYTAEQKDKNTTEINVLEGYIEVSNINDNKKIMVEEGYRVTATKDGISEPQKIGHIERWWEL